MKGIVILAAIVVSLTLTGCANTSRVTNKPKVKVNASVETPNSTELAIYLPEGKRTLEFFSGTLHRPGKALQDSVIEAFKPYFKNYRLFDYKNDVDKFGLLLDLDPEWKFENGKVYSTINYNIYLPSGENIRSGTFKNNATANYRHTDAAFFNSSFKALQSLAISILNKQLPSQEKFPSAGNMAAFDLNLLINADKPVSSGTAFLLNSHGNFMTSNHVVKSCMVTKVKFKDGVFDVKLEENSKLLDLAVFSSAVSDKDFLPIRKSEKINLGEKVVSVSYPLKGVLASSANLTLGNVTSKKALQGSLGLFQFSAPIQPGSSGGALVAESGEVIGVVTSTLNAKELIEEGIVPQNINFALQSHYLSKFLDAHQIQYETNKNLALQDVNDIALASTGQVVCYQ
ncbi:serine protease [Thalassotalea euphylliae]|uniref:S1 family peptidase n=1 Tax=Thalassotalea euphylliae TaxID=1655234 RepID=UPI00363B8655